MEARKREKEAEAGLTDAAAVLSSLSQDSEERAQQLHRDSASTLNQGSSTGAGSVGQSYELQPTESMEEVPRSVATVSLTLAIPGASANVEEGNSQQVCKCECLCVCV